MSTVDPAGPALVLEAGDARALVLPSAGGRLASLVIAGDELLWNDRRDDPMRWGSYPMVPWAGRVRRGRFTFAGREHRLPLGMPPHAIHGVGYDRPWRIDDVATISIDLDERWPFGGRVTQRFAIDPAGLTVSMTLEAEEPMPATLGWHPWFRRMVAPGGDPVVLRLVADAMLPRDAAGIPVGPPVAPMPGPWDDTFTGVHDDPVLEWPGRLRLAISSTCAWWVVFSEPEHAICVEPQSGPPDAFNTGPQVVEPGDPLTHRMRWSWTRL